MCAHSCRLFIKDSPLNCKDEIDADAEPDLEASTSCFLTDAAFLRTMALCIEDHCDESVPDIEHYWAGHLATGTVGDWSESLRPSMTYQDALRLAHEDVHMDDSAPMVVSGEPLNQTSRVSHHDFLPVDNWQKSFQWGEFDHGRNRYASARVPLTSESMLTCSVLFLPAHPSLSQSLCPSSDFSLVTRATPAASILSSTSP